MTDEKYTLISDIKEKKAAARGAFARKGGRKSKRCSLPSDHLTPAQLKRRNSQVKTFRINQFIRDTDTLRELPKDLLQEYLDTVIRNFNVNRSHVADAMGVSHGTLRNLLYRNDVRVGRKNCGAKTPRANWPDFINGLIFVDVTPTGEAPTDPDPIVEVQPVEIEQPLIPQPPVLPDRIDLSITGTQAQLIDLLSMLTEADRSYSFRLSFTK